MIDRKKAMALRKAHRYLGIILGLQYIMWTISGMYFSWTDIDSIHGDQFKNLNFVPEKQAALISPSDLETTEDINHLELRVISDQPYYWVNKNMLYNAHTGAAKESITEEEAISIAGDHMQEYLQITSVKALEEAGKHHEYREKMLPAYVISYKGDEALKAYVSMKDGKFQTVRHRDWRIFDFLWMTHTMDYEGRDNFNTTVLRAFSLLGLITVLSGFALWYISSPTVRKLQKRIKVKAVS